MLKVLISLIFVLLITACGVAPDNAESGVLTPVIPSLSPESTHTLFANDPKHGFQPGAPGPVIIGGPGRTPEPIKVDAPLPITGTLEPFQMELPAQPGYNVKDAVTSSISISSIRLFEANTETQTIWLEVAGNLPTPCHDLRVSVNPPDAENRIFVNIYSLNDPAKLCVQVLEPFTTSINLGTLAGGPCEVYVNNVLVDEILGKR